MGMNLQQKELTTIAAQPGRGIRTFSRSKMHGSPTQRGARAAGMFALTLAALLILVGCSAPFSSRATITPIYAATNGGVSIFDGSTWKTYTTASGIGSNSANDIVAEGSGSQARLYLATASGFAYFDGSSWTADSTDFGGAALYSVTTDPTAIFVGGSNGLYRYDNSGWSTAMTHATWGNGAASDVVNDIFDDGQEVYLATGDGIAWTQRGSWRFQAASGAVTSVFEDQSGGIYFGTSSGLFYISDPTAASIVPQQLTGGSAGGPTSVNSIFVDTNYTVYAAASDGLWVLPYFSTTWTQLLIGGAVHNVFVSQGVIYAGTDSGLMETANSGASWTTFTVSDGLGSNTVNRIYTTAKLYSFGG